MPTLSLPNTIDQNTTADAIEVQQNFSVAQSYVNTDVIRRDGGVAMTGQLVLVGDPASDDHAASKGYVDALLPVGVMLPFCGTAAPAGQWAMCNGASLPLASYPKLFTALGYRYGGSGGNFNVPNMAARVPVGVDSTQPRFDSTGKTGGSTLVPIPSHLHDIEHTHTTSNELGSHVHRLLVKANSEPGTSPRVMRASTTVGADGSTDTETWELTHNHSVAAFTGNSANTSKKVDLAYTTNGVLTEPVSGRETTTEHLAPFVVVSYIIRIDQT